MASDFVPTVLTDDEYAGWLRLCDERGWKHPPSKEAHEKMINDTRLRLHLIAEKEGR